MTCVFGLRIEAMTNICDWIKEFSSYIKLRVSGAGNKYSIWLQFEWLQCCIAQSSGGASYLCCRVLQWQRPARGTISHRPPDTGAIIIMRCHTPGYTVTRLWSVLHVSVVWRWQSSGPVLGCWTMAWPHLFRSWLWEAEAPPGSQGGPTPIGWWGRPGLWPDSSLGSMMVSVWNILTTCQMRSLSK